MTDEHKVNNPPGERRNRPYDAVLLVAFGAPDHPGEIRQFLAELLKGRPIPPSRVEEVVRHYDAIGGYSPFNENTFAQAAALREKLDRDGPRLPVYVGMRNWTPYLRDVLREMSQAGIRRVVGIVMAPHRSEASFDRYVASVREAQAELGAASPEVDYVDNWHDHPLFIEAVAAQTSAAMAQLTEAEQSQAQLIFTAHSIPTPMAAASRYVEQVTDSARMVARAVGHQAWSLAFQSRSGSPRDPWLEPDIAEVIRGLGGRPAIVVPIGFICDHVEVLYDLDIAVAAIAREAGVHMVRAATVNSHPRFIAMMADVIRRHIDRG